MGFFDEIWKFVSGTETEAGSNNLLSYAFYDDKGKLDFAKTAGLLGGIASTTGLLGSDGTPPPVGYQGTIPDYDATRSRVANTYDPTRRAGSGGQRYFSDMQFTPKEVIDDEFVTQASTRASTDAGIDKFPEGEVDPRIPDWMVANPNYDPSSAYATVMRTYTNPVTGETYDGTGAGQYMVDPRLGQDATNYDTSSVFSTQALGLEALNAANLARQDAPADITPYTASDTVAADTSGAASGVVNLLPAIPDYTGDSLRDAASRYIDVSDDYITPYSNNVGMGRGSYAAGGIAKLREGRYLAGATDGMADKVPASIEQVQPAALSDGEYVIPADVVSHLGNGNSDAGAGVLDTFLTKVRKSRTGNGKQGKEIDPNKLLPKVA